MDYHLMEPPILRPFQEMSKKEAKEHFDWYINQIPARIDLLKNVYSFTGGSDQQTLDFTPNSLKPLWKWFIKYISIIPKSQEEIEKEKNNLSEHLKCKIVQNPNKLSLGTVAMAMDIAIYFCEVLARNNQNVKWGILAKTKNHADFNQPVLFGFLNNVTLNPRTVVYNLANKASKGDTNPESLFEVYKVWLKYLPSKN